MVPCLPVYQHGQPLVAVETHRLGVGVGAHGAGMVGEEDLARHDVPRGDQQAAALLPVQNQGIPSDVSFSPLLAPTRNIISEEKVLIKIIRQFL